MESQRAAVVAEAMTWLNTPYRSHGKIKGAGADCMTLIVAVAEAVGILQDFKIPPYSSQFGAHRSDETYLLGIMEHCREIDTPEPGDIAIWKAGRVFSHAGIVIGWPRIIHAHVSAGVIIDDTEVSAWFTGRERKFFSAW